jgi:tRNA threonylcarbamoyladenosine biosynthesis protein TsaB
MKIALGLSYFPRDKHHFQMKILAIDTSTQSGGAAILEGDSVLSSIFEEGVGTRERTARIHPSEEFSSKLFRYVGLVLERARIALADVDVFAVTAGPGSFTGLRVGLAAVKAWSEVYGKPIAAISGLEAIAAQSSAYSGHIAAVADARRGQVFGAIFERHDGRLRLVGDEVVARPEDFLEQIVKINCDIPLAFISPEPGLMQEMIGASSLRDSAVERASEDLAPWVGRLAYGKALRGQLVDALTLDANYVRREDAEMYWKDS